MKKILFIILVVTAFNLGAQDYEYVPFATEDALWSVSDEKYSLYGDTVINGIKYSKVYRQEESEAFEFDISKAEYFCAIRNDIENKRVYGVYKDDLPVKYHKNIQYDRTEGKEFLLYDFSLNMGDTVSVANFAEADKEGYIRCVKFERVDVIGIEITNKDFLTLNDTDSLVMLENGMQRKRILMSNDVENIWQYWIEGIGSSDGPFRHYNKFEFEHALTKRLLCYNEDNEYLYYQNEFDIDGDIDCFIKFPSDVPENCMNDDIKVYPNPATSSVEISYVLPEKEKTATFVLTNTLGVNVLTTELEGNNGAATINLDNIPSGIYFYTVRSGDDVMTGKLVVK